MPQTGRLMACFLAAIGLLAIKILVAILVEYQHYFPPSFTSDFLDGRAAYFWRGYHLVFYIHIISSPCALMLGAWLAWSGFRVSQQNVTKGMSRMRVHRRLGRVQIALVLALVAPSGAVMAAYTRDNATAALGFLSLAGCTFATAVAGWFAAARDCWHEHARWMTRCLILLSSALVLRLMGGLTVWGEFEAETAYAMAAWGSWCIPLLSNEAVGWLWRRPGRMQSSPSADKPTSGTMQGTSNPQISQIHAD